MIGHFPSTDYGSEAELLVACRRREMGAFEQLYRTHGARLKSIAHHTAGNRQDAEDAVQDTFLKAYRGIDGFAGASSMGTWLCRICINACYDLVRKRQLDGEPASPPEPRTSPRNQMAPRVQLDQALRRIRPRQRMVAESYTSVMDEWHFIAERKIREGMAEGLFDRLEGAGEPIDLEENPFEDPSLRMAHRLLKNNGFAPAWIEESREIETETRHLRAQSDVSTDDFRDRVAALNRRIAAFNLKAPAPSLHKRPFEMSARQL